MPQCRIGNKKEKIVALFSQASKDVFHMGCSQKRTESMTRPATGSKPRQNFNSQPPEVVVKVELWVCCGIVLVEDKLLENFRNAGFKVQGYVCDCYIRLCRGAIWCSG